MSVTEIKAETASNALLLGGQPLVRVVYAPGAPAPVPFAATELVAYLERAAGVRLPIEMGEPGPGTIYIAADAAVVPGDRTWDQPGYDRVRMQSVDGGLLLMGENPRAALYAVYDFLQAFAGVRFFGPGADHEIVPRCESIALPSDLNHEMGSAFEWRDYFARSEATVDFTFKNRINCYVTPGEQEEYGPIHAAIHARGGLMRGPGHLWRRFLPDADLFDTRPELFALIEGKRQVTVQGACFSNPEVRRIFMDKLRAYLVAHPFWDIFALWAEDSYYPHYCGCEQCATKTTGEWYMTLVNEIAEVVDEVLPSHLFEFAAYHETRWPTLGVDRLYKNGATMVADLSLGYTRDLFSPLASRRGGSAEVMEMYEAWRTYLAGLGYQGRLLIVDYYNWCEVPNMSPAGRCLLWPLEVIRADAQFYAAQGIHAVSDWVCFDTLCWPTPMNLWAWLRLWSDPDRTVESLRDEFYPAYFGSAAELVRSYGAQMETLLHAPIGEQTYEAVDSLGALLDQARAAETDSRIEHRIEVARSHHAFVLLHLRIWNAFTTGDEATWLALEASYREFIVATHRERLTGEIDIPGNWPWMWYDFYVKQGRAGVERLLKDGRMLVD